MRTVRPLVFALSALMSVACDSASRTGGGGGGGGGGGTGTSTNTNNNNNNNNSGSPEAADRWCNQIFNQAANKFAECFGGTAQQYLTVLFDNSCPEYVEGVRNQRRIYDAQLASACMRAINTIACENVLQGDGLQECERAMGGAVAAGESCSFGECVDGTRCEIGPDGCTGSCINVSGIGGACQGTSDCQDGLRCNNSVCAEPPGLGAPCEGSFECGGNLWCNNGACSMPNPAGTPCTDQDFRFCAPGLTCAGPAGAQACRASKKIGEACTPGDEECFLGSCSDDRRCVFPAGIGDACGAVGVESVGCQQGFCSVNEGVGTCITRKMGGEACMNGSECESFNCDEGLCVGDDRCP